jgi:methylmalonyl-CoA mutase
MNSLYQDFSPKTPQQWLEQISKDLKGKPLEEILVRNYEQIPIKAFFTKEDIHEGFAQAISQSLYQKSRQSRPQGTFVLTDAITFAIEHGKSIEGEEFEAFLNRILEIDQFYINIELFHNAGATAVQELAYSLSMASTYLEKLSDKGADIAVQAPKIGFTMAVGSNYFMEIAKLRVLPWLYQQLVSQFLGKETIVYPSITAKTARINKSRKDAYNNLIRATLEAMAATIAKVDSVVVLPFDEPLGSYDEFSERIAENILHLLEHETKLNFVIDIASGSYFVEYLTEQLARRSWDLFVEIEKQGGWIAYYEDGNLKRDIQQVACAKIEDFQAKKIVEIGVNKYPNTQENVSIPAKDLNFFAGRAIQTFRFEEFLDIQ